MKQFPLKVKSEIYEPSHFKEPGLISERLIWEIADLVFATEKKYL